ncbi:unnamed protein product [Cylicostephanus goldi]|uniref:Uncharacterized protein n=1 Tax=Cylicostephanus goldi TaxID=71465 RepID=A0A3P6RSX4_CYLGO|nr:unnamed protein product [Cylicostephanus goldi]
MCGSCVPKIQCRITAALAVSCYVYQLYTCKDLCNVPISAEALERHGEGVADVVTMVPTLYSCGTIQNVVVEMYLHQYFSHKESVLFVDTLMTTLDSLQENARRCDSFNKTTLVILYINEIGDFCGALVKKHRRRSTGVIFEFGSRANHCSSLDFLTHTAELHGHVDCRFNVFAQSPFVFTHRSEFALAVGYCVSHGTTELSQRGLRQFSKRLFDVTFCGGSIPSVNTENVDDTLLPLVEFTDEESDYETIDGVKVALHLGAMDKVCQYCGAFSFKGEIKSLCCNGGTCMVPNKIFSPRKDPFGLALDSSTRGRKVVLHASCYKQSRCVCRS